MTTAATHLLHTSSIDVRELPPNTDLIEALRRAIDDPELGSACSWTLSYLRDDVPWYQQPALLIGLRDGTGALAWDDEPPMVPVNGANPEPVDYWLGGLHHTPMDAHTEIPVEQALKAVEEFMRTGQRPTCIEWVSTS